MRGVVRARVVEVAAAVRVLRAWWWDVDEQRE